MSDDATAAIEYESLVFSRHLAGMPGRTRRTGGVLDQSAYTLLTILQSGGPATIGELSSITGLDASTLNRQTAALVREDYADRVADPDGGVARKFRLSERGEQVATEERRASREGLATLTVDWSDQDRATFAALLRRLNLSVEGRSGRNWPRPGRPPSGSAPSDGRTAEG